MSSPQATPRSRPVSVIGDRPMTPTRRGTESEGSGAVELKAGAKATPEGIVAHCRKHLAGFKVPRAVVFGELPKTSTGKIQKFELRRQAGSAGAIDV